MCESAPIPSGSQPSFDPSLFHDLTEEPRRLLGAAPVDGESEASVAVVVYHLKERRVCFSGTEAESSGEQRPLDCTSIVVAPACSVSHSRRTLLRTGRRPDQSCTTAACWSHNGTNVSQRHIWLKDRVVVVTNMFDNGFTQFKNDKYFNTSYLTACYMGC